MIDLAHDTLLDEEAETCRIGTCRVNLAGCKSARADGGATTGNPVRFVRRCGRRLPGFRGHRHRRNHAARLAHMRFRLRGWNDANVLGVHERMTILGNGNVGIGTTSPDAHLEVEGTGNQCIQVHSTDNNESGIHLKRTSGYDFQLVNSGGDFFIRGGNDGGTLEKVVIKGNGRVGISGTCSALGTFYGTLDVRQVANTRDDGIAVFNTGAGRSTRIWSDASNVAHLDSGDGTGILSLNVGGGVVGVGTASPVHTLHIAGSAEGSAGGIRVDHPENDTSITSGYPTLLLYNTNTTVGNYASIYFGDGIGGASSIIGSKINDHTNNYGDLQFWTRGSGGSGTRMHIDQEGQVGIGTTTPAQKLDVVGGHVRIDSGMSYQWDNSHERIEAYNGGCMDFYTNNSFNMTIRGGCVGINNKTPQGRLDVLGSAGELLAITNDLSDVVFSANDVSGLPMIEATANGNVIVNRFRQGNLDVRGGILGESDSYTKLLIHSDTNDSNTCFIDSSSSEHGITVSGDVHHETTQKKFGSTAIQFDGTDDYLIVPSSSDWTFAGEFTLDAWIYPTASNDTGYLFSSNYYYGNGYLGNWVWRIKSTTSTVEFRIYNGTSNVVDEESTIAVSMNTWQHLALTRDSSNRFDIWLDGVSIHNFTDDTELTETADSLRIGNSLIGSYPFIILSSPLLTLL